MIIQTIKLDKINISLATAGNAMRHFDLCFSTCAEALPKFRAVRKLCLNFVFAFVNFQLLRIWIESRFLFVFILLIF